MPKLTKEQIQEMRELHNNGKKRYELAKMFGVALQTITYWTNNASHLKSLENGNIKQKRYYKEGKTWHQKNPEKSQTYKMVYRHDKWLKGETWSQKHPKEWKEYMKDYNKKMWADGRYPAQQHPDKFREYKQKYMADKRENGDLDFKNKQLCYNYTKLHKMEILNAHNNKCDICGDTSKLETHHTRYIPGKEGLRYIKVLCRNCHRWITKGKIVINE